MNDEIQELRKRLKTVEDALNKLGEQDLRIVKMISRFIFPMELRIATTWLEADKRKSFLELWDKKRHAVEKKLEDAQTVKTAFDVIYEFDKEIATYVKATKVDTADKAMEIAHSFIKKYSPVALPLKAVREDDVWLVDIDVGALAVKVAKVKVDARTGGILNYEIPEKK